MSDESFDEAVSDYLPAALELTTAYIESTDSPDFYWQVVHRVLSGQPDEPDSRTADEVILGLSALSSILLDQLALRSGMSRTTLLAHFHQIYLNPVERNRRGRR